MVGIMGLCIPDLLGLPNVLLDTIVQRRIEPAFLLVLVPLAIFDASRVRASLEEPSMNKRTYPGKDFDVLGGWSRVEVAAEARATRHALSRGSRRRCRCFRLSPCIL